MSTTYYEVERLSSPQIYLIRILVFLAVLVCIVVVLFSHLYRNFSFNPALNGMILGCLAIGIFLALGQIFRLFPEVKWVNQSMSASGKQNENVRDPVLLAAMASLLNARQESGLISTSILRSILESIASRLDESRDILRYMTGLLVFLGLLGTFWGLTDTIGAVSAVIGNLDIASDGDAGDSLSKITSGIGNAVGGMGTSFSSSLFGLAGSLILGFIALQTGQAQARFYNELEEWLSAITSVNTTENTSSSMTYSALPMREMAQSLERLTERIDVPSGDSSGVSEGLERMASGLHGMLRHLQADQRVQREWMQQNVREQAELKRVIEELSRHLKDRSEN